MQTRQVLYLASLETLCIKEPREEWHHFTNLEEECTSLKVNCLVIYEIFKMNWILSPSIVLWEESNGGHFPNPMSMVLITVLQQCVLFNYK